MADDDYVIEMSGWQRLDFEIMAHWYGVDADELIDRVVEGGAFERQHDDYVFDCWEEMEDTAIKMGGKAVRPFDFIEADSAYAKSITDAYAQIYAPALSEVAADRFKLDGLALVDAEGRRFELELVSEGWEYFVCPDLPRSEGVLECELVFDTSALSGFERGIVYYDHEGPDYDAIVRRLSESGNPPVLRVAYSDGGAALEYSSRFLDIAEGHLVPRYTGHNFDKELDEALAADPELKYLHDKNIPESARPERAASRNVSAAIAVAQSDHHRPMTALLREAYHASAALGADPTRAQNERYETAMGELEKRFAEGIHARRSAAAARAPQNPNAAADAAKKAAQSTAGGLSPQRKNPFKQ